jgi:hypothetical protein
MKFATIVTILSASLIALLALTATAMLSDLGEPTDDLRYEDIEAGWLLTMFCGPTLWSKLPSFPQDLTTIVDLPAFAYVCACLLGVVVTGWRWPVTSRTGAAMLTLGLGILPSLVGAVVLQDRLAIPVTAGVCVSFMIMGLLYSAVVSLLLAISDLPNPTCCVALKFRRTSALCA